MTLVRTGYPMYCAHFPGGDPRRFEPDPDGATPAEMAAWEAACQAADELRVGAEGRIAGRLAAHGRLVEGQARAAEGDILVELERGGLDG